MVKGVGKRHKVLALYLTSSTLKKPITMPPSSPVIALIRVFGVFVVEKPDEAFRVGGVYRLTIGAKVHFLGSIKLARVMLRETDKRHCLWGEESRARLCFPNLTLEHGDTEALQFPLSCVIRT